MMDLPALKDWLPIRVDLPASGPQVDWARFGNKRLLEPFFQESVSTIMRRPFELLYRHQTPIEVLAAWQEQSPGIPPTGFIFHMSRCGSTLVCQMLAALAQNVVVSEAPAIDDVLRAARLQGVSEEERIRWFRGMVSALGQPRAGGETHLFVKFDAWHALELAVIRKAFPEVPWIFLFRDPVEVLVSLNAIPSLQSSPGMTKFGVPDLDDAVAGRVRPAEYTARILTHVFDHALTHLGDSQGRGRAVSYQQLPEAVVSSIAGHFQLALTPADTAIMRGATTRHAKRPMETFVADTAKKQEAASPEIRDAARRLMPAYEKLCGLAGCTV